MNNIIVLSFIHIIKVIRRILIPMFCIQIRKYFKIYFQQSSTTIIYHQGYKVDIYIFCLEKSSWKVTTLSLPRLEVCPLERLCFSWTSRGSTSAPASIWWRRLAARSGSMFLNCNWIDLCLFISWYARRHKIGNSFSFFFQTAEKFN